MFKSKEKITKVDPNTTDTLVGEGSIFEGNIKSDAGLRVEGQIKGDIHCQGDVTIGEKGIVHSNITARNIIIAGTVHGNVHANTKLSIHAKGKLYGNITTVTLSIEEGSIFEGTSRMENIESPANTTSRDASSANSNSTSDDEAKGKSTARAGK